MVALVLFLLGAFGLSVLQANLLVKAFKERINLMVELQPDMDDFLIEKLTEHLSSAVYTKAGTVTYISKEAGAQLLKEEFGEDFFKLNMPNPLYDVVRFNVKSDFLTADQIAAIQAELRQRPEVSDVFYQESVIDKVADNVKRFAWVIFGLAVIMILIAVTMINNTIKLALYTDRFLVKNKQLVGATWGFISRPYLLRSFRHGLLSSCFAIAGLIALLWVIEQITPELALEQDFRLILLIFGAIIIVGTALSYISTYFVINKYLRMRVDDLY